MAMFQGKQGYTRAMPPKRGGGIAASVYLLFAVFNR